MISEVFNANPTIYAKSQRSVRKTRFQTGQSLWVDDDVQQDQWGDASDVEPIDQDEIFGGSYSSAHDREILNFVDLIRSISDPEHPNSLEELRVVSAEQIDIKSNLINVEFTPTVPHCGMSTLIGIHILLVAPIHILIFMKGLSIRVRLMRCLPPRFKVDIRVKPGSHQSELAGMSACTTAVP